MKTIALTGATGYVGGRLAPALLERGYRVKCLARSARKLESRPWRHEEGIEVVECDLEDTQSLTDTLRGCEAAYYLVHSMVAAGEDYAEEDRRLARGFAQAAAAAGVTRIVYLGGLGDNRDSLSEHLRSRREVEQVLASTGVAVTTLRAAMIIGSGSASFEILRYLVNRLPLMITPRWVETECQPVAISDVIHWLVECLEVEETKGRIVELGGPDVLTYRELMQTAAEEFGLGKRVIISVPLLTPRLSSAWISLVTPVSYRLARPLADGMSNRVVVEDHPVQAVMPHDALAVRQSIRRALDATQGDRVVTRWSAAGPMPGDPDWSGGKVFVDRRDIEIEANPAEVFKAICRVGGGHGWYAGDILWQVRGWMDQLIGGPGLRRGRRHTEHIDYGETLDFWRVVGIDQGKHLSLRAEMKLPGEAQLDFDLTPNEPQTTTGLVMTARFRPRGLAGIAYWYSVVPLHHLVFGGMLKGIKRAAEG